MDITELNKAEVLAALYNGSKQQGMGFMDTRGSRMMTVPEAAEILKTQTRFDYLYGRVMKINLSTNDLETYLYNRDNGPLAAEKIINDLKSKHRSRSVNTESTRKSDDNFTDDLIDNMLSLSTVLNAGMHRSDIKEDFTGAGGDFGGGGASGSWDSGSSSSDSSSSSSD